MGTTNILDLNNRVTKLEKAVSGGDSAQANKVDIATEFCATTAYTAGCFVYYGGKLYQFNVDHAAGAWDPTDVVEANVTDQVVSNKAAIEGLTASDIMMSDGVTSVEDKIGNMRMSKLWENPNTAINFDAQTIQLSSSDFNLLLVIARYATTLGDNVSNISSGASGYVTFGLAGASGPANYSRLYSVNGNQVTFGDCEMSAHNSPSKVTTNNALIPYQIYGIKLT